MRKVYPLVGAALLLGCMDSSTPTTAPKLAGAVVTSPVVAADRKAFGDDHQEHRHIGTKLSADEETSPAPGVVVTSPGHGQAQFTLSKDGQSVDFVLVVNGVTNVNQAHIHMAAKGATGGIVVWLFPQVTGGPARTCPCPEHNGLLAKGTFTAANLTGPLLGRPLSDLIAAIAAGNTYVNVHTTDGVAPANTGPGDFPGGELRGQLDKNGH